jgi:hypothetical protein
MISRSTLENDHDSASFRTMPNSVCVASIAPASRAMTSQTEPSGTRTDVDGFMDENQGLRMFKFCDPECNILTAAQIVA